MSAAVPLGPCSFKMDSGSHPLWYNCDPPAPFLFFCSVQRNRETDLVSGPGGEIGLWIAFVRHCRCKGFDHVPDFY